MPAFRNYLMNDLFLQSYQDIWVIAVPSINIVWILVVSDCCNLFFQRYPCGFGQGTEPKMIILITAYKHNVQC